MKKIAAVSLTFLTSFFASAGDLSDCKITGVGVFSSGWYLQCDGGTRSGSPACVTIPRQWSQSWIFPGSKQMYALALTHQTTGINTRLSGDGTCSFSAGRENITLIERSGM